MTPQRPRLLAVQEINNNKNNASKEFPESRPRHLMSLVLQVLIPRVCSAFRTILVSVPSAVISHAAAHASQDWHLYLLAHYSRFVSNFV